MRKKERRKGRVGKEEEEVCQCDRVPIVSLCSGRHARFPVSRQTVYSTVVIPVDSVWYCGLPVDSV